MSSFYRNLSECTRTLLAKSERWQDVLQWRLARRWVELGRLSDLEVGGWGGTGV